MKTNQKLKPHIPYTRHTHQTKEGLFMMPCELDKSKRQAVKVRRSQEARELVQALMVWGDDGGAVIRTPTDQQKQMEKL